MLRSRVYVLGQHRAGTTFIARCVAHDTGHRFYPEEAIDYTRTEKITELEQPFVLQCPFLSHVAHTLAGHVIWCDRDDDELIASQQRMYDADGHRLYWHHIEQGERARYHALDDPRSLASIKRDCWHLQKQRLTQRGQTWQEVDYHDYDGHPLHVADRSNRYFRDVSQRIDPKPSRSDEIPVPVWLG